MVTSTNETRPVFTLIQEKLTQRFDPVHLEVVDDSHKHAGHAAMADNKNSETHFSVTVVSKEFDSLPLIQRHRLVNEALADELDAEKGGTVHALAIKAKTPA